MFQLIDHPLVGDRVTRLRDARLSPVEFRRLVTELSALLVPAATASLPTRPCQVETPLATATGHELESPIILAPILRAGLGLAVGFQTLLPEAGVAHIGIARNEDTLQPEAYYFNTPDNLAEAEVVVLDPMLATGGSAVEAIRQLKAAGASRLRFVCLVACPAGVSALEEAHPEIAIYAAALDEKLDDNGYIWPGLGDAGDRTFGTL